MLCWGQWTKPSENGHSLWALALTSQNKMESISWHTHAPQHPGKEAVVMKIKGNIYKTLEDGVLYIVNTISASSYDYITLSLPQSTFKVYLMSLSYLICMLQK